MSAITINLINERGILIKQNKMEEANKVTKQIRKQRKKDNKQAATEALSKDIDIRDRWLGLRQMKKGYQITPYAIKDRNGKRIKQSNIAEAIADHLGNNTWNNPEAQEQANDINRRKIVQIPEQYNTEPPTLEELRSTIKRLKRRKACGPDDIPMELYKELDEDNLRQLDEIVKNWWNNEDMPKEETRARVVTIFKKGDTSNISNYRPISLLNSTYKIFTAILVERLADKLDKHLQKTQYGFRKNKSTANAIFLIRRLIDTAERSNKQPIHMLLLDWEKAFDKLTHKALFIALEKMNVDTKITNLIKMIYKDPEFMVETNGVKSEWRKQKAGIRQGCPLSPYLFLIAMTTIFDDIKNHENPNRKLKRRRPKGAEFDEILYADDTILASEDIRILQKYLHEIEIESCKYGLRLNKDKCEQISVNNNKKEKVKFTNGTDVNTLNEVKYLGCMINDKGNPRREIRKRVSECMCIMKKLDIFWKHTDNPKKWKIIVYNAIIRTKLMYGLESAQLNDSIKQYLDTFQVKGLRKILELEHTYINRDNTNKKVYEDAEHEMNIGNTGKRKPLVKISEYYDIQRRKFISQLIHQKETDDPRINITFNKDTLQINEYNTKRIGRPKFAWWTFALDELWRTFQTSNETARYTPMNLGNLEHIEHIKQTATENFEEQLKKKKNSRNSNDNHNFNTNTEEASEPPSMNMSTDRATEVQPQHTYRRSHTLTEEHHDRHGANQQEKDNWDFSEFDNVEPADTFKQTLDRHNAQNKSIIHTQFKKHNKETRQ